MKTLSSFVLLALTMTTAAHAQKGTLQYGEAPAAPAPQAPPPKVWADPEYRNPFVSQAPPAQSSGPVYVYDQKPFAGRAALISQEQAQTVINRFKEAYPKLGNPRLLIYVNRELVDEQSGLKLIKREEKIESASGGTNSEPNTRSTGQNTYRSDGNSTTPTLADRQTVRDIERLFGRPLRAAGATLVDQKVATQLIADRPLAEFIGSSDTPQARKDREALARVADTVIEILMSSRTVNVAGISGSQTVSVPDIQATAISLKDSKVLAQASSTDVTNRVPPASLGSFGVNEVTEATALALMEDMLPQ